MASYGVAGTLSRALLWLVLPLAAVMFPKIVHATAKSEKTNLLGIVLLGTAILAICGAAGLCVVGPLVVKLAFKAEYVAETTKLLPWYAGAMIPLALANVLVNDLLARAKFKAVPLMVLVAVAYGFTLPCDAAQISRSHGSGAANARRVQPVAAGDLRLVLIFEVHSWQSAVHSRDLIRPLTLDFGLWLENPAAATAAARGVFCKSSLPADARGARAGKPTASKSAGPARRTETSTATSGTATT